MTTPSSSLTRLMVLFDRAAATPVRNEQTIARWAVFLGIVREEAGLDQAAAVTTLRAMALLNEEFERGRRSLEATPFVLSDYEGAFNRARQTIDLQQLNTAWSSLHPYLSSETLGSLRMCSRVTPVTEQLLDATELEEVDAALAEVARALEDLPATDGLARVLAEQLAIMKQARVDYQIGGAGILRRAMYGLEGAMINQTTPETSDQSPAHATAFLSAIRLVRAVKTVLTTAGVVVALGTAVEGALHIAEAAATAEMFYLNSGPSLDDSPSK